jgi:hypothetical protein
VVHQEVMPLLAIIPHNKDIKQATLLHPCNQEAINRINKLRNGALPQLDSFNKTQVSFLHAQVEKRLY